MSRIDRDPNRGNRRVPLSTVSVMDLIASEDGDDQPVVFEQPNRPSKLKGRAIPPRNIGARPGHDTGEGAR